MLAIYELVYRIFFFRNFYIHKNLHNEPFNTVHKIFCYCFLCTSRLVKLGDFAEYLSLSLYLLTTQMTVPFNYLPYFILYFIGCQQSVYVPIKMFVQLFFNFNMRGQGRNHDIFSLVFWKFNSQTKLLLRCSDLYQFNYILIFNFQALLQVDEIKLNPDLCAWIPRYIERKRKWKNFKPRCSTSPGGCNNPLRCRPIKTVTGN